jgi:hypothetical protein
MIGETMESDVLLARSAVGAAILGVMFMAVVLALR